MLYVMTRDCATDATIVDVLKFVEDRVAMSSNLLQKEKFN